MAKFEVHIPAPDEGGFNVTLKVDADNWMAALKAGLTRIGEQGSSVQNVMVDMQDDNSIHITEPRSNRVFRIRELSEEEAAKAAVKRPASGIRKAPSNPNVGLPQAPRAESTPLAQQGPQPRLDVHAAKTFIGGPPLELLKEATDPVGSPAAPDESTAKTPPAGTPAVSARKSVADQTLEDAPKDSQAETLKPPPSSAEPDTQPPPKKAAKHDPAVFEKTQEKPRPEVKSAQIKAKATPPSPSPAHTPVPKGRPITKLPKGASKSSPRFVEELEHPTLPVNKPIGRARPKSTPGLVVPTEPNVEDMLEDVFERVQEIHGKKTIDDALYFVLDLALEKVKAEGGSVFRSDGASGDLHFAAARGPKAKELVGSKIVVPAGEGIAGFCAMEGVSVAISDVQKDPRYWSEVSEKVDYETKSVLCSPMMTHGRSFGCIQIINRAGGPHFAEHEVGIVSYLAHQAALYLNDYT